jgi:hypothetical protein
VIHRGGASPLKPLLFAYAFAALALVGVVIASRVLGKDIGYFTRDAPSIVEEHFYMGYLSSVGAVIWTAATTVCLLTWYAQGRSLRSPWLFGGLLSMALGADDIFLLHEAVYPNLILLNERVVAAIYGAALAAFLYLHRNFVRRHGAFLLPFAILLFAASQTYDLFWDLRDLLIEDGTKFLGVVSWAAFFIRASLVELAEQAHSDREVRQAAPETGRGTSEALLARPGSAGSHPKAT